ncbi:MAG TPA: carboxypeptidase-like regulatory domain-containing protein [Draconibacterium sp.]|nr:carboxypeptidase-like regulatory domain-containing protein [Draconibacterium sp.]
MRKFFLLITFLNFQIIAYNQVISGTIMDSKTDSTICFATIYFNGTFVGTSSDINGNFKLDISKNASMTLTVSSVGYYSVTLTDYLTDKPLIVYLEPKIFEINDVFVSAKSLAGKRKANLRLFKNEFLGRTANARSCEIINENDITFNYDSDRDTLKAFALKPIIIYNKALGYKITYYLDKFEYYRKSKSFNYIGNIVFNEDLSTNDTDKKLYEKGRKNSYFGSRMHFLRALWLNELESSGFAIKNSDNINLNYDSIVINEFSNLNIEQTMFNKLIASSFKLYIYYNSEISGIVFRKPKVYFDETGYYDSTGITWLGDFAEKRIGDTLPLNYEPK